MDNARTPEIRAMNLDGFFLKKAVDSFNGFDRLSAASTEIPLKQVVRKLKHFCSLKTE
jgi:hypothetical protein